MHERTSVRRADVAVVVVVGGSRRLRRERDEHGNRILDTLVRGILRCSFPFLGAGGIWYRIGLRGVFARFWCFAVRQSALVGWFLVRLYLYIYW